MTGPATLCLTEAAGDGESATRLMERLAGALSIAALRAGWPGARLTFVSFVERTGTLCAEPGPSAITAEDARAFWRAQREDAA